jgi:hypothetical protein
MSGFRQSAVARLRKAISPLKINDFWREPGHALDRGICASSIGDDDLVND